MNIKNLSTQKVGEIVSENYHAAGVFKEFGIDFCCGGGRPLNQVCEKNGISLDEILNKLEAISGNRGSESQNYKDWEPDFLIDYIINVHHTFVRNKTDEISAYAAKVARVYGEEHPENVDIFKKFVTLANEMIEHLEAEENTVFPLIKKLTAKLKNGEDLLETEKDKLRGQLSLMVDDHDGAGQLMADIRTLSHNYSPPEDACRTYQILYQNLGGFEEDLHKHVHLENNILFKKAEKLLAA